MPLRTRKKSKSSKVTVVKCALKQRIPGRKKHVTGFIATITDWVSTLSKIYREGSLFFNLHLLRLLNLQVDLFDLASSKLFSLTDLPGARCSTKQKKRRGQPKVKCAWDGCNYERTVETLAEFGGYCTRHKEKWSGFAGYVSPPKTPPSSQTCFTHIFKAVTLNSLPKSFDPELRRTLDESKGVLTKIKALNGITQSINYLAQAYQVNVLNHIAENFFSWQRRAIKALIAEQTRDPFVTDRAVSTLQDTEVKKMAWEFAVDLNKCTLPTKSDGRSDLYAVVHKELHYRPGHVEPSPYPVNKIWVKHNPNRALAYVFQFQKILERAGHKCFSIAPIADVKAHHVTIDGIVLYYLLKDHDMKIDGAKHLPSIDEFDADEWWDLAFDLGKVHMRRHFTGSIRTDGISMSIHYTNPHYKKPVKPTDDDSLPKEMDRAPLWGAKRVIAIDPGRSTLLHAVDVAPGGAIKQYKLTKKRYYHESHITRRKRLKDKWLKHLEPHYQRLAGCTTKTPSFVKFKEYVATWKVVQADMWTEMLKKRHARGRLDVYAHKRKSLDKFFDSFWLDGDVEPVIAYGDAGFSSSAKGEISAPTISLFKRCQNHYQTCLVDEYNTTKMCYGCKTPLIPLWCPSRMIIMDGKAYGPTNILPHDASGRIVLFDDTQPEPPPGTKLGRYTIRGLRRCNSPDCHELIDRDANAALNIRRAGIEAVRPAYLCRPT